MRSIIDDYPVLNDLADPNGIVILGGADDMNIPLGELRQAFAFDAKLYNRSVEDLSVVNAQSYYDRYVSVLQPACMLLHIGARDRELYSLNPDAFDRSYRGLIAHIRKSNPKCEIAMISVGNPSSDPVIAEMNRRIHNLADSERCQFGNINTPRVWNPKETRSVVSFVHSIGFVRPLTSKHPLGDLIRVLFCYHQK